MFEERLVDLREKVSQVQLITDLHEEARAVKDEWRSKLLQRLSQIMTPYVEAWARPLPKHLRGPVRYLDLPFDARRGVQGVERKDFGSLGIRIGIAKVKGSRNDWDELYLLGPGRYATLRWKVDRFDEELDETFEANAEFEIHEDPGVAIGSFDAQGVLSNCEMILSSHLAGYLEEKTNRIHREATRLQAIVRLLENE